MAGQAEAAWLAMVEGSLPLAQVAAEAGVQEKAKVEAEETEETAANWAE